MQSQLRPVLALALVVATGGVSRGACNVAHELARLTAAPEVAALAADIDTLEHRLVPALVTKRAVVSELLQ